MQRMKKRVHVNVWKNVGEIEMSEDRRRRGKKGINWMENDGLRARNKRRNGKER